MKIDKNLAFDIGAHMGLTIPMIKTLGYDKIVCVEPDPENFSALIGSWSNDKNIIGYNYAASNVSGEKVILIVNKDHNYLNTLEPSWIINNRHEQYSINMVERTVETITLDKIIEEIGSIPAYIKVDVEGHELQVFEGLHYKPDMLSFEWISEAHEKNVNGVNMMNKLGFTDFVICFMEETPNKNHQSYNAAECSIELEKIKNSDIENKIWGNIWCR